MEFPKLYTVAEAQQKLREIKPLIAELRQLKETCRHRGYDVYRHQYYGGMGPNGQKEFPPEMERLVSIVSGLADEGIQVKDLDKGLIDFLHERLSGEIVLLCYLDGEPEITAWHTLDGGFGARQSLDLL